MKKIKSLHFTIGNGLDNLARQGYWFEDKQEWALKLLDCLCMGITKKQKMDVLNGDAKIIGIKKGTMTKLVYEENKEFKKEILEHFKFLKEQKKQKKKGKKHLDFCGNKYSHCKFNSRNSCCFGMRNNYGCYLDNPDLIQKRIITDTNLRLDALMSGESHAVELIDEITIKKVFEFIFKGHHYTINDSARNQSECPQCEHKSKGYIWNKKDDKKAFIGIKEINKKQYIHCFECPKCFKKFFYHNSSNR